MSSTDERLDHVAGVFGQQPVSSGGIYPEAIAESVRPDAHDVLVRRQRLWFPFRST
jgi:hypothetical protein